MIQSQPLTQAPSHATPPGPRPFLATPPEPLLAFHAITRTYGRRSVLTGLDLTVPVGDFMVVFGPPAAGKSVLLRILMGLEQPDAGQVYLRGSDVTQTPAPDRNIGYVPQSFALYPHLSVRDNIAYPLKLAGVPKQESDPVVAHVSEMLRITDLLAKRPDQLSGGQKQRVAIARGIAKQTDLFVLDDPLAGLDFKLRERLVDDLKALQEQTRATFLYTTSDPLETLILADHVAILDAGRIVESGDPERVYRSPHHARGMALLGFPRANFLAGAMTSGPNGLHCRTPLFDVAIAPTSDDGQPSGTVQVGLRPEAIALSRPTITASANTGTIELTATVLLREDLGGEEIVYLDCAGTALTSVVRHSGRPADERAVPDMGEPVTLHIDPADLLIFSPTDGRRLGQGTNDNASPRSSSRAE